MPTAHPDEAAVRERAYYLWEQDGRPEGRATEYSERAKIAVSEKSQMDTLTKPPPKHGDKTKAEKTAKKKPKAK